MTDQPKRRGRPPANAEAQPEAKPVRRKRSAVVGGGLKLHAPEREGFRRRFVNDKGNRLSELQELGYTFVEGHGIDTHGPGSRINRLAGTKDGGEPLKTYLMETPVELWEQGMREKEEDRSQFDQTINRGLDPTGETGNGQFNYRPEQARHSSITVELE